MTAPHVGSPPRRAKPNEWLTFWQAMTKFQRDKLTPWLGLRNTVGVLVPLSASVLLGQIAGGVVLTTGALNVSFTDSHEPYAVRAKRMLGASALVGLAVFAGGVSGNFGPAMVALAGLWAFAAGMLISLSGPIGDMGVISLVTLVVFAASPQSLERAAQAGVLAAAGGLFQTSLALLFWPIRRFVPERRALGEFFLELGRAAALPAQVWEAPPASAQSTRAQQALAPLRTNRSVEGERHLLLLAQAERMRLSLLMLGRLRVRMYRDRPTGLEGEILDQYFAVCCALLTRFGAAVIDGAPLAAGANPIQQAQGLAEAMRQCRTAMPTLAGALSADARLHMDALNGQLRSALDLASSATPAGQEAFQKNDAQRPWRLRVAGTFATLNANLTLRSAVCRHAIRLAACIALGEAVARGFGLGRSYWVPMTVAIILKPDFTATFSRGLLRLIGTFTGLLLATGLFHLVATPTRSMEIALLGVFVFALRSLGGANYGVFTLAVTGLVVLLLAATGTAPQAVMAARALNTVIGGALALLAYALWPTWERAHAPEIMAKMLDAYRDYFRLVKQGYLDETRGSSEALDHARLAARLSRSNLEASIDRLIAEPKTPGSTVAALTAMLASSHRLINAAMALEAGLHTSSPAPARAEFRAFANDVERTLHALSAALRGSLVEPSHLPDLREGHHRLIHSGNSRSDRYVLVNVEADRIANSLNTYSLELFAWLAEPKPGS